MSTADPTNGPEAPDGNSAQRIAAHAAMLAGLSGLGLILTVLWQMEIAALFGASRQLDGFWIGAAIPKAIADSFHLGILTLLFVVVYNLPGPGAATRERHRLASSVFNVVFLGTLVVAAGLFATAPLLVDLMGPGLDDETRTIAVTSLRALVALLIPTALVGAVAGVLNAHRQFRPFAVSRVFGLAAQIVLVFFLAERLGVSGLVWALILGAVVILGSCIPAFRKTEFRYERVIKFGSEDGKAVLRMLGALVGLNVLSRLNQGSDRFFASLLEPGSISALEFGWRFEIPVSQILAFSVALPTFALLAIQASQGKLTDFRETVVTSTRLTGLLVLPVIGFLVVMRGPLTLLWFQHGEFSTQSAEMVSSLIPFLALCFICQGFAPIMVFGMLSLGELRVLLTVLVFELAANTGLNALLHGPMGVQGVALATALAMIASNIVLWSTFLRRVGGFSASGFARVASKTVLPCAGAIGVLALLRLLLDSQFEAWSMLAQVMLLGLLGVTYLASYGLFCERVGLIEIQLNRGLPRLRLNPDAWS